MCKKALPNGRKISTQQKIIAFQKHSDICLVSKKKVTHSGEQSKSNVKGKKI